MSPTGDFLVTYFSLGGCLLELAQELPRVALAWHLAGSSTPFGVTGAALVDSGVYPAFSH